MKSGIRKYSLKKMRRDRKGAILSQVQNETIYLAIQEIHSNKNCTISELCRIAEISRSAYYKWLNRKEGSNEQFNKSLIPLIKDTYEERNCFRLSSDDNKAYLSAILDLSDKSIVAFVLGHSNNDALVFETFDIAHGQYPESKPIFHSDRGFQDV